LAQLDTLLQSQRAGRRGYRSPWSAGACRTLAIAAFNLVVLWSIAGAVVWQGHRDAVADGKRTAANFSLATAAYTQQALLAADLILRSMLDWVADENIQSEAQFVETMRQQRLHDVMQDRVVALPQVSIALVFDKQANLLNSSLDRAAPPSERQALQARLDSTGPPLSSSRALMDPSVKRWTFYLSRKIASKSDRLLGMAAVGVDSDYFANLFRKISLGEDCSVSLFRLDGALLATTLTTPDLMGRTFDDAPALRMIRQGLSGTAELVNGPRWWDTSDSQSRIVAPRQVEGFPILVAVTIGERALFSQWRLRLYFIVALALLVSVLVALVTARLLRLGARTESAAHLAAERRLLAALIDTPAALCAVLDGQGRVIYCNERFREVVAGGRKPDDIMRDPAVRGGSPILAFAASIDAHPLESDLEVSWPGKPPCYLHFSASRQLLPEIGHCTILVGHDETPRRQAQQTISQTAKLVTLGEMTTGIAHELSQPLNVIKMAAQNALAEVAPGESRHPDDGTTAPSSDAELRPFLAAKLNRIMAQVDRAAAIIARMRVFGRTPSGPPGTYDLRHACREALTLVEQRLRSAGIAVREELGDVPLEVRGHENLLEQALVSLLLNARDALQQSSRTGKTITLSARRGSDGHVLLTVADNGPGVPAEIRDRIFEPFFSSKPTGHGTGLGLSLSFGIVREAGGTLSLLPGDVGAAFQIDLPGAS
jgi:C4-dicarboxylate-specific signal transduction histidine kinase